MDPALCLAAKAGRVTCQLCWVYCPDACIAQGAGPAIDLTYCKGCGICAQECPAGAIVMVPEAQHGVCAIDITEIDVERDSEDQRTVRLGALLVLEALAGLRRRIR